MARKRRRKSVVRITNSPPGGRAYTSFRSALNLVKRGRAAWESPTAIYLLPEKLQAQLAESRKDVEVEQAIGAYRGGVVFWNGPDRRSKARHRPGEVRS